MSQMADEKLITIIAIQVIFCDRSDTIKTYNYVLMLLPWSGLFTELDIAESFVTYISAKNATLKHGSAEVHIWIFGQNYIFAKRKPDIFYILSLHQ